jgi:hypothetical protein
VEEKDLSRYCCTGRQRYSTTMAVELRMQRGKGVLYSVRAEAREMGFRYEMEMSSS